MKRPSTLLRHLAAALADYCGYDPDGRNLPTVRPAGSEDWCGHTHNHGLISWEEGPYGWTMVSAGSDPVLAEYGIYSKPPRENSKLAKVLAEIDASPYYLEAVTHWQLSLVKA